MSVDKFLLKPWGSESLAQSYTSSLFHLSPAPEYANGEVVLAAVYRSLPSNGPREQNVPA